MSILCFGFLSLRLSIQSSWSQNIPLERLLEEEAVGMALPVDATYFNQFPLIFDDGTLLGDKILV